MKKFLLLFAFCSNIILFGASTCSLGTWGLSKSFRYYSYSENPNDMFTTDNTNTFMKGIGCAIYYFLIDVGNDNGDNYYPLPFSIPDDELNDYKRADSEQRQEGTVLFAKTLNSYAKGQRTAKSQGALNYNGMNNGQLARIYCEEGFYRDLKNLLVWAASFTNVDVSKVDTLMDSDENFPHSEIVKALLKKSHNNWPPMQEQYKMHCTQYPHPAEHKFCIKSDSNNWIVLESNLENCIRVNWNGISSKNLNSYHKIHILE